MTMPLFISILPFILLSLLFLGSYSSLLSRSRRNHHIYVVESSLGAHLDAPLDTSTLSLRFSLDSDLDSHWILTLTLTWK
jgi:hypothetical protein